MDWRGSISASLKLKGIDGLSPQGVEYAAQFDLTRETLQVQNSLMMDRLKVLS